MVLELQTGPIPRLSSIGNNRLRLDVWIITQLWSPTSTKAGQVYGCVRGWYERRGEPPALSGGAPSRSMNVDARRGLPGMVSAVKDGRPKRWRGPWRALKPTVLTMSAPLRRHASTDMLCPRARNEEPMARRPCQGHGGHRRRPTRFRPSSRSRQGNKKPKKKEETTSLQAPTSARTIR